MNCFATDSVCGYEALARFESESQRSPDRWFADASEVAALCALECAREGRWERAEPHVCQPHHHVQFACDLRIEPAGARHGPP